MRSVLAVLVLCAGGAAAHAAAPPGRAVATLVRQFRRGDTLARQDAAEALGRRGPRAAAATPDLMAALTDYWTRYPAALALGRIGLRAIPLLMAALKDRENHAVRKAAGFALARMGSAALPALVRALEHRDRFVRLQASETLHALGPRAAGAMPVLLRVLVRAEPSLCIDSRRFTLPGLGERSVPVLGWEDHARSLRYQAALALTDIGPKVIPGLLAVLERKHERGCAGALADLVRSSPVVVVYLRALGARDRISHPLLLAAQVHLLAEAVRSPDRKARRLAAEALGEQGRHAVSAVPALARALRDEDTELCLAAAGALGKIGPPARAAIPALLEAIKDRRSLCADRGHPEDAVSTAAVSALRRLGPVGREALRKRGVPILIKELGHPNPLVRRRVLFALRYARGEGRAAVPTLLRLFQAKARKEEIPLLGALGAVGVSPKDLVPLLKHRDPAIRRRAGRALCFLGGKARPVAPALVTALKDRDEYVRRYAASLLAHLRVELAQTLPMLVEDRISDRGDVLRRPLATFGPVARGAIPALQKVLADNDDSFARLAAARELVMLDAPGEEPLAVLVKTLESPNDALADRALGMLRELGQRTRPAGPALLSLLQHKDTDVRARAALILVRHGGKETRQALTVLRERMHADRSSRLLGAVVEGLENLSRREAVQGLVALLKKYPSASSVLAALGRKGRHARPAVPLLRRALRTGSDLHRVTECLGRIGPDSAPAVPELMLLLRVQDEHLRGAGAAALAGIGSSARRAVPRLRGLLADPDRGVCAWAAYALLRITRDRATYLPMLGKMVRVTPAASEGLRRLGPAARAALPELLAALESPHFAIRAAAVVCLGGLGRSAVKAVPALVRLLQDENRELRREAAWALGRIGPPAKAAVARLKALVADEEDIADAAEEALTKIRPPRRP
jgi:HEAT repeat protein